MSEGKEGQNDLILFPARLLSVVTKCAELLKGLEGSTQSHPVFEPLTEHHALSTGFFNAAIPHREELRGTGIIYIRASGRAAQRVKPSILVTQDGQ
jgi:hypothetical protein